MKTRESHASSAPRGLGLARALHQIFVRSSLVLGFAALSLGLAACAGSGDEFGPGQTEFVSANPNGNNGALSDAGAAGGGRNETPSAGGDAAAPRTVEEAAIVRVEGNLLYVLNEFRGLQVVDITNPDTPSLLGMAEVSGYPIEMYVRGNRAYVVVSNYFDYWASNDVVAGDSLWSAYRGSQIRVFDISTPAAPAFLTAFNVEGEVTDTRIVGDVLYAVSNRYAWYDSYRTNDMVEGTYISSINIADEANLHQVDEVVFPRGGWDNHVHVTPNTIYVASSGWQRNGYQTNLRVVDISDPAGDIQLQGEATLDGWIRDRWQMDEFNDVFRVVTAPDWNGTAPKVYTFSRSAAGQLTQLAMISISLPRPESLTAVRFDGPTAYVVTYERVDPLFVIDLSDPLAPLQRGSLTMPGWLDHIAPRGDRLVALGHDDTNRWQLAVSLFDVSDLDAPALLGRVAFGDNWGWLPDERDNFDKVFKVLDSEGLVLVPFYSYGFDDTTGYWHHAGGVQLIDFDRQSVTLRGLVDHAGYVKRAIPHGDRLLTVSNERMQTVDITNRDAPQLMGEVELSRNVVDFVAMGNYGVQLVGDWYSGDTRLVVVPLSDYDLGAPLAEVQVTAPYGRLYANGSLLYLVSRDWRSDQTKVTVVDFSTPTAPVTRGELVLPSQVAYWGYWGWGWYGSDEATLVGNSTLVFHTYRYWWRDYSVADAGGASAPLPDDQYDHLYIVDLKNPDQPSLASTMVLRAEDWVFGMKSAGNTLYFTHNERSGVDATGRNLTRYYLDRVDLSVPSHPVRARKVNVPGYVIHMSDNQQQVFTLDNQWYTVANNGSQISYAFNALDLRGQKAYLRDRLDLSGNVGSLVVKGEYAYMTRNDWGQSVDSTYWNESHFEILDLSTPSDLQVSSDILLPDDWGNLREVDGGRAFVDLGWRGGMLIYDVSDPNAVGLDSFMRHPGWVNNIEVVGNTAFVALGNYGVDAITLGGAL